MIACSFVFEAIRKRHEPRRHESRRRSVAAAPRGRERNGVDPARSRPRGERQIDDGKGARHVVGSAPTAGATPADGAVFAGGELAKATNGHNHSRLWAHERQTPRRSGGGTRNTSQD